MRYKTLPKLAVPAELMIPTCDNCGSEWMNDSIAAEIDKAMEPVYECALNAMARRAIHTIAGSVSQSELERALGLSAGYISKLKNEERDPSPEIVARLATIARNPKKRIREILDVWEKKAG